MIAGVTLCAYRDETFFIFLPKLNPKPDVWIINNDTKPLTEGDKNRFQRVADNYNKIVNLLPENTDQVLIMEDDAIPPKNGLNIHVENMKKIDADGMTFGFYSRCVSNFIQDKTHFTEIMASDFYYSEDIKQTKLIQKDIREGVQKIDTTSFNFVLLKREILDKIKFYGINKNGDLYIDNLFFLDVKKLGYKIYCDYDQPTSHVWSAHWPGNKHINQYSEYEKSLRRIFNLSCDVDNSENVWIFILPGASSS